MLMVYGLRHLEALPDVGLLRQYEQRIDHFSLGVMGLEVLFALWTDQRKRMWEVHRTLGCKRSQGVRLAWRAFWSEAMGFYQ